MGRTEIPVYVGDASALNEISTSPEEFEEFIVKSGAKGSFMVYRTDKKDQELGIDEL